MVEKEVKIKVSADVEDSDVKKLDDLLDELLAKKKQMQEEGTWGFNVESSQVGREISKIKQQLEEVDDEPIKPEFDDSSVQLGIQNISDGFSRAKQGVLELKDALKEVEQAGMQSEQNKAFLEMNLGPDKAKQTYQDISDIVARMPGDDNTMRSVLSTAQALGNDLKPSEMEAATKTMADYMAGSATMGKMATESQQDIMKYLLDGNTAELERGSIVSSQVDKLKEANTFMERQAAMQQVLNDLGYGGISTQDTMLNKQAEWEGMLYNSQDALSSMWLGAEKGAMDYILQLNDATGGLVGMGIVAGSVAGGPIIDTISGLGQMATGMKAIKDVGIVSYLRELDIVSKLSAASEAVLSAATAAYGTIVGVLTGEITLAEAATMAWNAVLAMNPIILVVIALIALAAALIWAYQNVDWFRAMVDNAWASIVTFGQQLYSFISGALSGLVNAIAAVGAWLVGRISASFSSIWSIISAAMNLWNQATAKARAIATAIGNAFSGVRGTIQGAFNGVTHAITAPFMNAYNTLKPIIDNIKAAWDMLMGIGGSAGITTGSAGISMGSVNGIGSANTNLISNISNATGGRPNIVLNGIIEESAGDFIVRKLSDEIYKQNVLRGVE